MNIRELNWNVCQNREFDVVIIGGGINGASAYKHLATIGYRVLLIDENDFASGSSQSSAMMIWGGLLYLKNLDFNAVYNFSKDRDSLIQAYSNSIIQKDFRYIPNPQWGRNPYFVFSILQLYWMLGSFKRKRPYFEKKFNETDLILNQYDLNSVMYQEGFLKQSDSRFVLDWILDHQSEEVTALNYCELKNAHYASGDQIWHLDIKDKFTFKEASVKTKLILNCAGVWTDTVNSRFGIKSPYKHVFSKGVFIGYERPEQHQNPLIFETGEHGDVLTLIPWGPVSLWGPTETMESSIQHGFSVQEKDIDFLLMHAKRNLESSFAQSKIISLRCGLRPLAVDKTFKADCYPLDISRHHKIHVDDERPWISVYGGKISGCLSMAKAVLKPIQRKIPVPRNKPVLTQKNNLSPMVFFPGLEEKVPTMEWCVQNEFCCTIEDYLRRRTNIAQWVPREGIGYKNENLDYLETLVPFLPKYENLHIQTHLKTYCDGVSQRFDPLVSTI